MYFSSPSLFRGNFFSVKKHEVDACVFLLKKNPIQREFSLVIYILEIQWFSKKLDTLCYRFSLKLRLMLREAYIDYRDNGERERMNYSFVAFNYCPSTYNMALERCIITIYIRSVIRLD